jgi:hypothetical protein
VKEISIIFIPKQILMIQITNKISRLLLVFLVSNLIAVNMYAGIIGGCPDNENGKWNEGKRSVSSDIPITIYVENGQLVIKSHSLRSDITIRIMDSSTMVYEETVLAEKTGYILIDLKDNKSGVYTLNLTNQWGDHLYGEFTLE